MSMNSTSSAVMAQQLPPTRVDLPLDTIDSRASSANSNSRLGLTSPRVQHFAGDIPPTLSPLDALAAHSRKLAKELEETRKAGERRMSRLPPQLVKLSLSEHQNNRPTIFRALSDGPDSTPPLSPPERLGLSPKVSEPKTRPVSSYPRISAVIKPDEIQDDEEYFTPTEESFGRAISRGPDDYFDAARSESPRPLDQARAKSPTKNKLAEPFRNLSSRQGSTNSHPDLTFTLAPPNAAFARVKGLHESSDDEYTSSAAGSTFSKTRKLSSSSGMSIPRSPASPYRQHHPRTPSNNSTGSLPEPKRRLSHMNFSRPMSSAGFANFIMAAPVRKPSKTSQKSQMSCNTSELPTSPTSFDDVKSEDSEGFMSGEASSYTHATYVLPRGRMADRTSAVFLGLSTPHFEWQEPMFPSTPPIDARPSYDLPQPSPGFPQLSPTETSIKSPTSAFAFGFPLETSVAGENEKSATESEAKVVPLGPQTAPSPSTAPPSSYPAPPPVPATPSDEISQSQSSRSESTIRPSTARSVSNYQAFTADEHVEKAIELHQHGDLKESTYHLRIAAKQNHATGMLLYALACRHGWGMRPNQREGVQWLRKAVDSAMLDIADDEDDSRGKSKADIKEKKTHRAQFALSIYELGVSHLNGWGIEQDKALALRCFEIAGNWGDTDALSEAGFCYAEGIGCKKDLKKAATFYRMAEARGVSMIGNSWIHKDKYNDDEANGRKSRSGRKGSTDKGRSKSKTRSIFARKKSTVP